MTSDRELRAVLRRAGTVDAAARERSWRVVRAAYAAAPPAALAPRRSRRLVPLLAVLALAALAAGTAGAASRPDTGVGRFVRHVLGVETPKATHPRPALVRIPGGGRLLAQAGGTTWVVAADGSKRRLGRYDGATWSPHGLFVAAWRGGVLSAVEPRGRLHWTIARPHPIASARWAPVDGFRIAYLSGGAIRIVNGDGTGDRRLAAADLRVAPAWRPDTAHVVAYADRAGRIVVTAVDTGEREWRSARQPGLRALAWAPDGRRLLAVERGRVRLFSAGGGRLAGRPIDATSAAWSPDGTRIAVVGRAVTRLDAHLRGDTLFSAPGPLGAPTWAPNGNRILVPWPGADQWLFLQPEASGQRAVIAVGRIGAQFSPGAAHGTFAGGVSWCCPPPARPAGGDARRIPALEQGILRNPNDNARAASCRSATDADRARAPFGPRATNLYVCTIDLPRAGDPARYDVQLLANNCFVAERRRPGNADYGCIHR